MKKLAFIILSLMIFGCKNVDRNYALLQLRVCEENDKRCEDGLIQICQGGQWINTTQKCCR